MSIIQNNHEVESVYIFQNDGENIVKYSPEDHKDMFDDNEGKLKMAFYEAIN